MTYDTPHEDLIHTPEAETRPFRLALHWFVEGCVGLLERFLDRFDLFESWISHRHWALYDRIARSCVAFLLCVLSIYVLFLIGYAAWYVAYTPGGQVLMEAR